MNTKVVNFVLLQACWFAAVLGSAAGSLWIGPACVVACLAIHFGFCTSQRGAELRLVAAVTAMGLVIETALRAAGVSEPAADVLPAPWSPLWLVLLWAMFATAVPQSLSWLRGRYGLAALFGAVAGAAAYHGGARLGALQLIDDPVVSWTALATAWGAAVPALVWLDARLVRTAEENPMVGARVDTAHVEGA